MSADIKEIAQRLMEEGWNNRRLAVVDEVIDPAYKYHDPNSPDFAQGPEGYRARILFYEKAFPDMHFVVEDVIAEADRAVIRWHASATHQGELLGIPATGRSISGPGMSIMRFENGKIVEDWCVWDTLGVLRQIGALPASATGQAA